MSDNQIIVGGNPFGKRDTLFDSLKFILICCVVLGHVLNYSHDSRVNLALWNWLYSFEMPLFVFISGYFSKIKSFSQTFRGCLKLFETLLIWNFLYCLFEPNTDLTLVRLFKPAFAYWYLMCLIIWRFMLQIIPLIKVKLKIVVLLTFVAGILWGFLNIDGGFMSNSRVIAFFPFFILGYYAREKGLIKRIRNSNRVISYAILIIISVLIFLYKDALAPYFNCSRPYISDGGTLLGISFRLVFYIVSLLQGYALLNIAPNNESLAKLGEQTMPIYVFHGFVLIVLMKFIGYLNLPMSIFFVLFYSVAICTSIIFMGKFINYKMLLNPISTVFKLFDKNI